MISALPIPEGGVIAEVGVLRGDFSLCLLEKLKPRKFVAFDTFNCHKMPKIWGTPSKEFFDGLTQLDCFRRTTAAFGDVVVIERGLSGDTMPKYADRSFDLVYIDADHRYEGVKADAERAAKMVKDSGILMFDDYILHDHIAHEPYGTVPAVNEMIVNQGWQVLGFSLDRDMFCNIAIRKG
jgi:hypothetical protein